MGGVLDHFQVVTPGQGQQVVDTGREAPEMHDDHRPRARRDATCRVDRIDAEAVALNFAEDRHEAHPQHGHDRGPERRRGHQHFVARLEIECMEGRQQPECAVGVRQGMPTADALAEIVFQTTGDGMVRQITVPDYLEHRSLVVGRKHRPAIGAALVGSDGGWATENGWENGGKDGHGRSLLLRGTSGTATCWPVAGNSGEAVTASRICRVSSAMRRWLFSCSRARWVSPPQISTAKPCRRAACSSCAPRPPRGTHCAMLVRRLR